MSYEQVPLEVVELIRAKPVVAYKLMSELTKQSMMLEGISPSQDEVDQVIYQFLDKVSVKEIKPPKPEELN